MVQLKVQTSWETETLEQCIHKSLKPKIGSFHSLAG